MNTIIHLPAIRPTRTYPAWHTGTVTKISEARVRRDNKLRAAIWPASESMRDQIQREARK